MASHSDACKSHMGLDSVPSRGSTGALACVACGGLSGGMLLRPLWNAGRGHGYRSASGRNRIAERA
eukprot:2272370-Alexandrium_andersonii.AAC.1